MGEQENRKAYALAFASYLLRNISQKSIEKIILYGSVAKSQSTKESDIDIFIEVDKETKRIKNEITKTLSGFYKSKEAIIFRLIGVENDINLKISKLDKWPELKRSILSDGIVLWGKFESRKKPENTEHKIIFFWDKVGKNRTVFLNKLYGYKTKNLEYKGALEKWQGIKTGKSCIMIPIKYRDEMIEIIRKYKVKSHSIEVFC